VAQPETSTGKTDLFSMLNQNISQNTSSIQNQSDSQSLPAQPQSTQPPVVVQQTSESGQPSSMFAFMQSMTSGALP